jgi:hypothetical protein
MRFEPTNRVLRDMVRDFHVGAILLPQFQRDYVWKPTKIRNLLDSLLRGFPIGGFYLWRPQGGNVDAKPKGGGLQRIEAPFVGYLIDGQQRLTSLEAAYHLFTGDDKRGAELRCYLDLAASDGTRVRDTRLFVTYAGHRSVARRVDEGDSTLIPLSQIFDGLDHDLRKQTERALATRAGFTAKRVEAALARFDHACRMLDQMVPCTTIYDVSDEEAVEVFARLNKGGSALRQGDVRAAELARGKAVDVLKQMRNYVAGDRPKRLGFGFSFAFRSLVVFHRQTAQFSSLKPDWIEAPGPRGQSLSQSWKATERAVDAALAFIDVEMGWSRRALLPSNNAVIALAVAIDKADAKMGPESKALYRRWLCLTALRNVFQGSIETTLNRFFRAVRDTKSDPALALVKALKRDEGRRIRPEDLNRFAQPWGPVTQVMHSWLVGSQAIDWLSGERIDVLAREGNASLPGGDLTVHHIFARKVLADLGMEPDEANCPANYALLSRSTNSEFLDQPADEVHATLTPDQRRAAGKQYFGDAAGDRLKRDRYKEFCQWRADRLAEALNDWLGID